MNTTKPPGAARANERVATAIRGLMAQQKKSSTALAEHLGISRQAAGRKAGGSTAITVDELETVAAWLGVEPATLLRTAEDY